MLRRQSYSGPTIISLLISAILEVALGLNFTLVVLIVAANRSRGILPGFDTLSRCHYWAERGRLDLSIREHLKALSQSKALLMNSVQHY